MASKITQCSMTLLSVAALTSAAIIKGITADPAAFAALSFDYVVIGGGTAGLLVASRLADNPNITVGVIEAGLFRLNDTIIDTPVNFGKALGNPDYDWNFGTVPQTFAKNRNVFQPRGKLLGGSSATNFMALPRASKEEYDAWVTLGNPGWGWDDLLPYFKAAETYHSPRAANPDQILPGVSPAQEAAAAAGLNQFEGFSGPIQGSFNEFYSDLADPFVQSANSLGIFTNRSPDYGNATGVTNSLSAVDRSTGKRSYATAFYLKNAPKANFVVLVGAQATKIVFKPQKVLGELVAESVQFAVGGKTYTVKATREVILSAGAFQTPQLLELSGIGNAALLNRFNITPLVDLPAVGENLQDHIEVPQDWEVKDGLHTLDQLRNDPNFALQEAGRYQSNHTGMFTTTPSILAFIPLDRAVAPSIASGIQSRLIADLKANPPTNPLYAAQYAIQTSWFKKYIGEIEIILIPGAFATNPPLPGKAYISIANGIQHPFSRGSVHINSSDPLTLPLVDPKYLSRQYDLECLRSAFQFATKIASTPPLSNFLVQRSEPVDSLVQTPEQLDDYLKDRFLSVYHPLGTAPLAPRNLGGVVSPKLVVYGTKNLRVVDGSVIPLQIATHPQLSIYAIAGKAVSLINADR